LRNQELTAGTVLGGDYVVEARIAVGGMGTVYACHQRSTGERRAVKVLSAEVLVDDDLGRRFELECKASGRIRSEHVVKVLAAGVESSRHPWIAMELLEGETLAQRVERLGPFDRATARVLFAQIGHALAAAHEAQLAHRDLKPENVYIARSLRADAAFTAKVLDFGIAKVRDALSVKTTAMGFGTPYWMAPEQLTPGAAWRSADVWALGLLAFFVLTGRIYWRTPTEPFAPPYARASSRARELLGHDSLPPGFDAWFARCVALSPEARYPTIAEANAVLDAMLAAPAVPATQPTFHAMQVVAHAPTERLTSLPPQVYAAPQAQPQRRGAMVWGAATLAAVAIGAISAAVALRTPSPASTTTTPPAAPPGESTPATTRTETLIGGCPPDMVRIPGGRVILNDRGTSDVPAFCLDQTEVRVADYAACVQAGACRSINRALAAGPLGNVCNARIAGRDDHPVNCAKRDEAERYCAWRGRRLPRNSEWELAARGADARTWPWGEASPDASRLNACGLECAVREGTALDYLERDPWESTAPVGSFPAGATPEGVQDLLGNVSEWVLADSPLPDGRFVVRGPGFLDGPAVSTRALRRVAPEYAGRSIGFRCSR
jgi:hypothetical protein